MPWATKEQAREWGRRYHARTKERRAGELFANKLKTLYGLSLVQYLYLQHAQGGLCAVCGEPCKTGNRLSVDHDHATGYVRGLLCRRCNTLVGATDEQAELLQKALTYIRNVKPAQLVYPWTSKS